MNIKRYTTYFLTSIGLVFFLLQAGTMQAQEDAISSYFSKYVEDDRFTSVYISPRMFKLIGARNLDAENPEMQNTLNRLRGLRILSADSIDGNVLYKEIFKQLNKASYEELMSVREPDSDIKFLIKSVPDNENKVSELLMLIGGENSFFMLSIAGINLDIDSVLAIAEEVGPKNEEEEEPEEDNEDPDE